MDTQPGKYRTRHRLTGSRMHCLSEGQVLLVRHEDPQTGASYWVLPGGREQGERFEDTVVREAREETGIAVRLVHRLRVPGALFPGGCTRSVRVAAIAALYTPPHAGCWLAARI